jgi:hypothetical protein
MTEVARPEDTATDTAATAPVDAAAAPGDDTERYLEEYSRATARPSDPPDQSADQPSSPATSAAPPDELDRLLDELAQPAVPWSSQFQPGAVAAAQERQVIEQQFGALQSENAQLRGHILAAQDRQDFGKLTAEIQGRLPQHLPPDYAETQLKAMAIERPELVAAFDYRSVDRKAVDQEMRRVEQVFNQTTDPAQRAALENYGYRLGVALNSREILRRATHEIVKRGRAFHQIDEQATAEHDAVVAAVRGASAKASPEPPPNFGQMSDKEFHRWTRNNLGF